MRLRLAALMATACIGAACGSSASKPEVAPATSTTAGAAAKPARTDTLAFREVLATSPYLAAGCGKGAFADRAQAACYTLGPVLLTGRGVETADPARNPADGAWEIELHFGNDDFVTKIATPYVNRRIAIVLDGVVESAPMINPGITGRDVTISAGFDEAVARSVAARIAPPSPAGATTTTKP